MLGAVMSFFGPWYIKLALVLALIGGLYTYHKVQIKIEVNKAVAQVVADIELQSNRESFKLKERSLNAQIELQEKFDNIDKEKNAKIQTLTGRVATLTRSLSERPNRPEASGVPNNPSAQESKPGATGAQLYRQDGEFLAGEAARAEEIKIELQGCYKSYDDAKETLDKFKRENTPKTD